MNKISPRYSRAAPHREEGEKKWKSATVISKVPLSGRTGDGCSSAASR